MSDSDVETYYQVSTAHSSSRQSIESLSQYSEQPSETAVDVIESVASTLSLMTCATSVSDYSMPPSETDVSFSQLNEDDLQNVLSDEGELKTALLNEDDEEGLLNLVYSDYDLPPAETDVEMDTCKMLYPQSYIPYLSVPERDGIDTPAPPQMFARVV